MALFMLIKKFIKDLWRKEISDVDIDKLSVILSQDSLLNYLIVYDLLPGTFKHQRSMLIERRAQPAHQIQNDYRMPEVHADSFKVFRKRCKQELMDKHPLPAAQIPTSEEPYDRQKIADDIVILFAELKATLIEKDLASEELIKYLSRQRNDLQAVASNKCPEIKHVIKTIEETDKVLLSRMSGSGSTCFGLYSEQELARNAVSYINKKNNKWWTTFSKINKVALSKISSASFIRRVFIFESSIGFKAIIASLVQAEALLLV